MSVLNARVLIKQHDISDCGLASLASVFAHYKLQIPIARIRQHAGTDQKGTNVLGLLETAKKFGFQAKGVKGKPDDLRRIPLPAIAHVVLENGLHHYVVIYKVDDTKITFMDPADGKLHKKDIQGFQKLWTGILVILLPSPEFKPGNQQISVSLRFWSLISPHKSVMVQALFGAAISTLLGLSTSIYIQKVTDHV